MGNLINLPNITLNSFTIEGNKTSDKKVGAFDAKNYLNTRLSDGEDEKTIIKMKSLYIDMNTDKQISMILIHNICALL